MNPAHSTFRRYDHVERLGHTEVEGIAVGRAHVFPKLDGANASKVVQVFSALRCWVQSFMRRHRLRHCYVSIEQI